MSLIEIKNLSKAFDENVIFKDICFEIEKGDVIAIIGPSGTGKSTFMRCLNFLEEATSGEIYLNGENILLQGVDKSKINQKMGMVFQSFNLFPHLMVIENVMKPPMDLLEVSKDEAYDLAMSLLKEVGMANKAYFFPDELSGGQKQRVAIARALAMKPEILLLDEPTSALDPRMVGEVMNVIRKLAKSGITMMIVTHEMRFAREITNKVIYMDECGIYESGPTDEIFDNPKKIKTQAFLNQSKVFNYETNDSDLDFQKMINGINVFGISNGMDNKVINKITLIAEELTINCIIPYVNAETIKIKINISNDAVEGMSKLEFRYNGEKLNLLEYDYSDEIPVNIVKKSCDKATYSFENGENVITLYLE